MKKTISLLLMFSLLLSGTFLISDSHAQTGTVATIDAAKEIAANAGGVFIQGENVPSLTGNQVALPVIDEQTGKTLGYIVAEKSSLVSALNAAGHKDVAAAVAAGKAAETAAGAVQTGFLSGTTGIVALVVVGVVGVGLALGGGGGGGGGGSSGH